MMKRLGRKEEHRKGAAPPDLGGAAPSQRREVKLAGLATPQCDDREEPGAS